MDDKQEPSRRRRMSPAQQRVMGVFVILMCLAGCVLFIPNQLQTVREAARVQSAGIPALATVVAVEDCSRFRVDFTLRFTTARGDTRTVNHVSYILSCASHVQAGESTAIKYVPDDPTICMTQAEINGLPLTLFLGAVLDLTLIGCGVILAWMLYLKPLVTRLLAPMRVG